MPLKSDVFMWNDQLETMSRSELEKLQLSRLQATLERVSARVPFYQKVFAEANLTASSIKSLSDLARLPFTSKSSLRDEYPFGFFAADLKDIARLHASSGTRGKPTVAGYTKNDLDSWADLSARSLACAGVRPGDVLHNSYGYGLFTGGLGIHSGGERLGCTVVPVSGGRTQQQLLLLKDFAARVLCCTPSYALNLALSLEENRTALNELNLEIGIFGAEPWSEECREQIEKRLGIKALDIYGLSEIMGPGVAIECIEERNGLHIWEDHFLVEIIDATTMEAVALGEIGELVITTLSKEALPLLRYRTGDCVSLSNEPCSCGRTARKLTKIRGRIDDMLIIRGVNVYPSEIESILFSQSDLAPQYQIVVQKEKALDVLTVRAEINEEQIALWKKTGSEAEQRRKLTDKLTALLKDRLGLTASVELIGINSLARSEGKAMRVLDLRQ